MKINPVFDNVIGQEIAKVRLSESIASARHGGEMLSPLVVGEAGLGKTHLSSAYLDGLEKEGLDILAFSSPEEFRDKGEAFDSVISLIMESPRYALYIDEIHLVNHKATIQMDKIKNFIMKALDKNNATQDIRLDANLVANFSRKRGSIILSTNFPELLDKSGALQSRCDTIVLDAYTQDELIAILKKMMEGANFKPACDTTLEVIAKCGRGTARPLEHIIDSLRISANARGDRQHTINRQDVVRALKLSKMYPLGLQPWEINILERTQSPVRDNVLKQMLPNIEQRTFTRGKSFLLMKGLVAATTQGLQRSQKGERYMKEAAENGFAVTI